MVTFVLVLLSWVLFRSESFAEALGYFSAMFGRQEPGQAAALLPAELYSRGRLFLVALGAWLALTPGQAFDWSRAITWRKTCLVAPAFGLAVMAMFAQSFNPFLYFQF